MKAQTDKTELPKRLIYKSFSPHDCEAWYSCPYCMKNVCSWSLPSSFAVDNGEKMYCPHCKKEVKYPMR